VISRHLKQWKMERMSKVSLAVLRLSLYEILYSDLSDSIAANEAVELCKKFATEEEAAYVNGILGRYGRDLGADERKQDAASQPMTSLEQE